MYDSSEVQEIRIFQCRICSNQKHSQISCDKLGIWQCCQNTLEFVRHQSNKILDFVGLNKILSDQTFIKHIVKLCLVLFSII